MLVPALSPPAPPAVDAAVTGLNPLAAAPPSAGVAAVVDTAAAAPPAPPSASALGAAPDAAAAPVVDAAAAAAAAPASAVDATATAAAPLWPLSEADVGDIKGEKRLRAGLIDWALKRAAGSLPGNRAYALPSDFFSKIRGVYRDAAGADRTDEKGRSYLIDLQQKWTARCSTRSEWTGGVDIFAKQFLLVPISDVEGRHWSLVIICHPSAVIGAVAKPAVAKRVKETFFGLAVGDARGGAPSTEEVLPLFLHLDPLPNRDGEPDPIHESGTLYTIISTWLRVHWEKRAAVHAPSVPRVVANIVEEVGAADPDAFPIDKLFAPEFFPLVADLDLPVQKEQNACGLYVVEYAKRCLHSARALLNPGMLEGFRKTGDRGSSAAAAAAVPTPSLGEKDWVRCGIPFDAVKKCLIRSVEEVLMTEKKEKADAATKAVAAKHAERAAGAERARVAFETERFAALDTAVLLAQAKHTQADLTASLARSTAEGAKEEAQRHMAKAATLVTVAIEASQAAAKTKTAFDAAVASAAAARTVDAAVASASAARAAAKAAAAAAADAAPMTAAAYVDVAAETTFEQTTAAESVPAVEADGAAAQSSPLAVTRSARKRGTADVCDGGRAGKGRAKERVAVASPKDAAPRPTKAPRTQTPGGPSKDRGKRVAVDDSDADNAAPVAGVSGNDSEDTEFNAEWTPELRRELVRVVGEHKKRPKNRHKITWGEFYEQFPRQVGKTPEEQAKVLYNFWRCHPSRWGFDEAAELLGGAEHAKKLREVVEWKNENEVGQKKKKVLKR